MAGPWFVDPDNGLITNNGLTPETPWKLIPGQTGDIPASSQTGYGVVHGDTINVKNGTSSSLRIVVPQNNLTFRGYGLASNVLELTLPGESDPTVTRQVSVVREAGVHEGMWSLDATGNDTDGMIAFGVRAGCTFEDAHVHSSTVGNRPLVKIGTSTQTGVGATLRRCALVGSHGSAVTASRPDLLVEDTLIQDIADDGIMITSDTAQSFHAGNFVTLRRLHIVNPGYDEVEAKGDAVQLAPDPAGSYQGTFEFTDSFIEKPSLVKQGLMLARVEGTFLHARCLWTGAGHIQVGVNEILAGGSVTVDSVVWRQSSSNLNPYVRFVDEGGMAVGSTMVVRDSIVDVPGVHGGLFNTGSGVSTISGTITIEDNSATGAAATDFTTSAQVGFGTAVRFDASAQAYCRRNTFTGPSTAVFRIPTGTANNSKYVFQDNVSQGALAYAYQGPQGTGTSYTKASDFEAAHSAATGNTQLSATRFVRPDASHGGANNGGSYADAWQGPVQIPWAILDGTDDTLYVCGRWGVGFTVEASGISRARKLHIRGDYAPDPCEIVYATTRTWTAVGNGEYSIVLSDLSVPLVVEDGSRAYGWNYGSQQRQTTWSVDAATDLISCPVSNNNSRVFADGDKVAFRKGAGTLPTGLVSTQWYYMRDVTSTTSVRTFKIATTPGGAALDIGVVTLPCDLLLQQARYYDPVKGSLDPGEYDWDYPTRTLHFRPTGTFDPASVFVALTNTATGGIIVSTQDYVHIKGFTIWGARTPRAIDLDGGTDNEASYNLVYASDGGIVVQGGGTNSHLHHNIVRDVGWHAYGSMDSDNPEAGMLIEYNVAEDCGLGHDYGDVQMFVTSQRSDGTVYRYNRVTNCGRMHKEANVGVFVVDNSSNMDIYGNIVERCRGKIFQIGSNLDAGGGFDNVRCFSNLIIDHNPDGVTTVPDLFSLDLDVVEDTSCLFEIDWRANATKIGRLEIFNNTVIGGKFFSDRSVLNVGARYSGVFVFRGAGLPLSFDGPFVIKNNIIANVVGNIFELSGTNEANYNIMVGMPFEISNNIYWNCSGIANAAYGTSSSTHVMSAGMTELAVWESYVLGDTNSQVVEPLLTDGYHPLPNSPVNGTGVDFRRHGLDFTRQGQIAFTYNTWDHTIYGPKVLQIPDGTYRMYYAGYDEDYLNYRVCVATSPDLVTWTKPVVNKYNYDSNMNNNIILQVDAVRLQYLDTYIDPVSGNYILAVRNDNTLTNLLYQSVDGLATTFEYVPNSSLYISYPENACLIWSPRHSKYRWFYRRGGPDARSIGFWDTDALGNVWVDRGLITELTAPDQGTQFYDISLFEYGGALWGVLNMFNEATQVLSPLRLYRSEDYGDTWTRYPDILGRPPVGSWDYGLITDCCPILKDDTWYLFYGGKTGLHNVFIGAPGVISFGLATAPNSRTFGNSTDLHGLIRPNPPSIGAYEPFQYSLRTYSSPLRIAVQNI